MNEHLGRHVKCFLRNSTVVEGIMEGCSTVIQLRSLDGKSLLIIHQSRAGYSTDEGATAGRDGGTSWRAGS